MGRETADTRRERCLRGLAENLRPDLERSLSALTQALRLAQARALIALMRSTLAVCARGASQPAATPRL